MKPIVLDQPGGPAWRPTYGQRAFTRRRPASVRLTECWPPEMMSQSLSTVQAMPAASDATVPKFPRDSHRYGWPPVAS